MSLNNNKKQKVEVVLPPSGAGIDSGSSSANRLDLKNQKQVLKNKINELKQQQKETANSIKLTQKELNKLSRPIKNTTTANKKKTEVKVVKKGRNKLNGKK